MADLVAIRVMLTGGTQVAAESAKVNKSLAGTGVAAEKAGTKIGSSMTKVGSSFKSTGKKLSTYVTLPLVAFAAYGIKTAASFGESMNQVKVAGDVGGKGMIQLETLAKKMGRETVFSSNESAEAMLSMVKGGITPAQIKAGALKSAMNLAATEGINLAKSGEIMTQSMKGFHISANESVRVADAFAGGSIASTASVEGLTESLAMTGPGAASMGISLEETIGTLASFSDHMLKGSDAGTSFKTFLATLPGKSKQAREEIDRLGLSFFNQAGEMKKVPAIADELTKHMGGLNDEELKLAQNKIFGQDASRAAQTLMEEGSKGLGKSIEATKEQGAAEKLAKARMKGLAGVIERTKGSFETMAQVVGELLAPVFEDLAVKMEHLFNKFTELPKPAQEIIIKGLMLAAVLGPLLWVIGALAPGVAVLAAVFGLLPLPIWLTIGAVIAMAAAFYIAYHKIKPFRDIVDFIVGLLGGAANAVAYFLFAFSPLAAVATFVIANLDHIRDAFQWVINAAKNVYVWFTTTPLGQALAAPFIGIKKTIEFVIRRIEDLVGVAKDAVGWAKEAGEQLGLLDEGSVKTPKSQMPGGPEYVPPYAKPPGSIGTGVSETPGGDIITTPPGRRQRVNPRIHNKLGRPSTTAGASVAMPTGSGGGRIRTMQPINIRIGKKRLAEIVAEAEEDARARL